MRILRAVIGLLIAVPLVLAGFTISERAFGQSAVGTEISARGTATVVSCTSDGFIDGFVVGSNEVCELAVEWDDGRTGTATSEHSRFVQGEVDVPAVERQVVVSKGNTEPSVYPADDEPSAVGAYASLVGLCLLAAIVLLVAFRAPAKSREPGQRG
ncbi:DUF6346 domain-containing protein [Actinokineospora pegani]|uniref:DUF6346 domain-containing protein n=1 Tax=Actinokineospora pegani TaxID=2654637 RepID=UPI0012EA3839|nr:DUF6346 domain-containing protein [Actinokineospora pegani]